MDLEKYTHETEAMDLGLENNNNTLSPSPSPVERDYSLEEPQTYSIPAEETGMSQVDEDDINIIDKQSPIVLLVGPPRSGKSMTLVRLARFLRKSGYTVTPDTTFKSDPAYRRRCEKFMENLNTREALEGTALNEFLMAKVVNHGRTVCQILEAPGEHYFSSSNTGGSRIHDFPPYLTQIIRNLPNRKIWIFITEADWEAHGSLKDSYVEMIKACKNQLLKPTDRIIILYNKVDRKDYLFEQGKVIASAAEREMKNEYSGLAETFRNNNPLSALWRPYNYAFVPFCSGYYKKKAGGKESYTESEDRYPKMLWDHLMKQIKG